MSCPPRAALVFSPERGTLSTEDALQGPLVLALAEQEFLAQTGGLGCWLCWGNPTRMAAPSLGVH